MNKAEIRIPHTTRIWMAQLKESAGPLSSGTKSEMLERLAPVFDLAMLEVVPAQAFVCW